MLSMELHPRKPWEISEAEPIAAILSFSFTLDEKTEMYIYCSPYALSETYV